jgi:tRNA threonylcarbamoyladenosine biosynthesis protein TsaB
LTTLALDTSTPAPSLCLVDGERLIGELNLVGADGGRRVLEGVHELLGQCCVDLGALSRIVVGVGPGNFTGLRIGIASALALGQALSIPVSGAGSVEALALGMHESLTGAVMAGATDARRGEVFGGAFRIAQEGLVAVVPVGAYEPTSLAEQLLSAAGGDACWVAGTATSAYPDAFARAGLRAPPPDHAAHRVSARQLVCLVDGGDPRPARPAYHRLPDAEVNRLLAERAG